MRLPPPAFQRTLIFDNRYIFCRFTNLFSLILAFTNKKVLRPLDPTGALAPGPPLDPNGEWGLPSPRPSPLHILNTPLYDTVLGYWLLYEIDLEQRPALVTLIIYQSILLDNYRRYSTCTVLMAIGDHRAAANSVTV